MEPKPSFFKKYKFTLISLLIIILAAIPLLLLSNTGTKPSTTQKIATSPSPTASPVTTSNVDPTLTQVDTDMQKALNQVDIDLQSVSQVDASKDSTTGL